MSKKYQHGRGLSDGLAYGMFLSFIISQIKELSVPIEQSLMLHNIFEITSAKDTDAEKNKHIRSNIRNLKTDLQPRIEKINEWIDLTNKFINGLDFKSSIPNLVQEDIIDLVEKRLKTIYQLRDIQTISNEHFRMQLEKLLQGAVEGAHSFYKVVDEEGRCHDLTSLKPASKNGMTQAFNICSIGYYGTSVFIAGRTVEECINSYYLKLFKLGKATAFDLLKMSFENKINKLHSEGLIGEKLFHDLSSARINRNEFGHPSELLLEKSDAYLNLRLMVKILLEVEKKMSSLR